MFDPKLVEDCDLIRTICHEIRRMKMTSELREIQFWTSLFGNEGQVPFEVTAGQKYVKLVAGS